jgi:hypothetical protein
MGSRRQPFQAIWPMRVLRNAIWLAGFISCVSSAGFASTNAPVRELGIIHSYGDAAQIFDHSVSLADLDKGAGYFLLRAIENCRSNAAAQGKSPQSIGSMSGSWLEWATLIALKNKGLTPAYWQAEFATVPDNFNDVMLWSKEFGPVIISCKTSLRERYKQADLEAVALRQHYPRGKFFLLTLDADKKHLARTRKKIMDKELLALQAIYAEDSVDELFDFLKTLTLGELDPKILRSGKIVR